jgi:MarR family transcriptional regulator, transcriptional regulator for hemolysin
MSGYELNRSFLYLLGDVSRLLRSHFDQRAGELGLTTRSQWRVLAHLGPNQGINQSALADILEIENMTLARHIDRLEEAGWVERRRDPDDRRVWRLFLSETALPMFDHMQELIAETEEHVLVGFSEQERKQILERLEIMKSNILGKEAVVSAVPGNRNVG